MKTQIKYWLDVLKTAERMMVFKFDTGLIYFQLGDDGENPYTLVNKLSIYGLWIGIGILSYLLLFKNINYFDLGFKFQVIIAVLLILLMLGTCKIEIKR